MPTLDAPSYYEHAKTQAPGRADDCLKWIAANSYMQQTGDVACSLGWVCIVDIDRDLVIEYVSEMGDPWISEGRNFDLGWYIIKQDDNGLVWGMYYGEGTLAEEGARADFAEAERTYSLWLEINET